VCSEKQNAGDVPGQAGSVPGKPGTRLPISKDECPVCLIFYHRRRQNSWKEAEDQEKGGINIKGRAGRAPGSTMYKSGAGTAPPRTGTKRKIIVYLNSETIKRTKRRIILCI
jgi:hypothetical protein